MRLRALILVATLFLGLDASPRMGRGFGKPSKFPHRRTFGFYKPWGPWKPRSDPSHPRQVWGSRDNLPVGQRARSLGAKLGSRGSGRKTFGLGVAPGLTIMTPHGMFITGFLGSQLGVEATFSLYHRSHHFEINSSSHFLQNFKGLSSSRGWPSSKSLTQMWIPGTRATTQTITPSG